MPHVPWYPLAAFAATVFYPPALARVYVPPVRELTDQRTLTSRTLLLADGTCRAEAHAGAIHYEAADGSLQPIDTALVRSERSEFALQNVSNTLRTFLPSTADGWVKIETDAGSVAFRALNAKPQPLSGAGSTASSTQAYPTGAVTYTVGVGKLKETITLASNGMPSFSWALRTAGLTPTLKGSTVFLQDAQGKDALRLPSPWMVDAAGKRSSDIEVGLRRTADGWTYTITPSPAWMAMARFPVVIDPSVVGDYGTAGRVTVTDNVTSNCTQFNSGVDPNGSPAFQADGTLMAVGRGLPCSSYDDTSWSTTISVFSFAGSGGVPADCDVYSVDFYMSGGQGYYCDGGTADCDNEFVIEDDHGDSVEVMDDIPWTLPSTNLPCASVAFANGARFCNVTLSASTTMNSYGYLLGFEPSQAYLTVTYAPPGWYQFQRNAQRTGQAPQTVAPNATVQWQLGLSSGYSAGQEPPLTPSVLAVPGASTGSPPVVYAAMANTLSRVLDTTNYSQPTTNQIIQTTFPGSVTGTPLYYSSKLYVPVNVYATVCIGQQYTTRLEGRVYVLNAADLTLAWSDSTQHPNPIQFSGPLYSSPTYNPINGGILVVANVANPNAVQGTGNDPKLYCKSSTSGLPLWNEATLTTLSICSNENASSPSDYPPAYYGSPTVFGNVACVGSASGWMNARRLDDGSEAFDPITSACNDDGYPGTPMSFGGRAYVAYISNLDGYEAPLGCVASFDIAPFSEYWPWGSDTGLADVWDTPALYKHPSNTALDGVIWGDDYGYFHGLGAQIDPQNADARETWDDKTSPIRAKLPDVDEDPGAPVAIRCSALVSDGYAFIGADDGGVYVLHADTGSAYNTATPVNPRLGGVRLDAPIRSSMASLQGRLYVLTTAGTLYCFH